MRTSKLFLGIDIGSVTICYVLMDQKKRVIESNYIIHQGNITNILERELKKIDLTRVCQLAYNHKSADFFNQGIRVNDQVAIIEGVRSQVEDVSSVFTIGGETFGLILFDENGRYKKFISNSSCAAGTGAFLDQQAERLGLSGSTELSRLAESYQDEPPKIATRCAVFAKTDLIHCQQQGYSIESISAGLCKGLAHNITDTLVKGIELRHPVAVVGGVSRNQKVMQYLSEIINSEVIIPENAELIGAMGCALIAIAQYPEFLHPSKNFISQFVLKNETKDKQYFFPPLESEQSVFPDYDDHTHYISHNVEIDLYNLPQKSGRIPAFLGIDIGSTSTKTIVMDAQKDEQNIILGLYTRTMGQPIKATQVLFQVLRDIENEYQIKFEFWGVGSTGSGRKFIQKVINADMAIDEITAHARAAYTLNPKVDTIIEIGGQDSKFTVMKDGQVTFSVMNYVCAAGTGSFIEEQAKRLNVPLTAYAEQAVGTPSPLTSDRCTVFMERDLNHFMSLGYSKQELLAAVLHSVRDNYLSKVAHLNKIGNVICFQGATAKNYALVMAFEQKLQRPIFVSKYCHLTGAMGVCLLLKENWLVDSAQNERQLLLSKFRGIDFYKESPIVTDEICDGCKNHCKLKRIKIANEDIVWGYLCGRDESGDGRKPRKQSGFDLMSNRRQIFKPAKITQQKSIDQIEKVKRAVSEAIKNFNLDVSLEKLKHINLAIPLDKLKHIDLDIPLDKLKQQLSLNLLALRHRIFTFTNEEIQTTKGKNEITIGIPNALYMVEYLPFFELFFRKLGYSVVISRPKAELIEHGKEIAGAEFCAPISSWHGHVQDLSGRTDYLFLPLMFENVGRDEPKLYCYYSHYAVSLVQNTDTLNLKTRCISPVINFTNPAIENVRQIYESLPHNLKLIQTPNDIQRAYSEAWNWFIEQKQRLIEVFQHQHNLFDDISVVLLGRPYLILDLAMNKNIPQKFNDLGVSTFFQDMLPLNKIDFDLSTKEFIDWNHWKFGDQILKSVAYICQNHGLYPVILTAFKCSPDSFVLNYFKEILDTHQKPYLILQIDEHGSDVGYEPGLRLQFDSFRNHYQQKDRSVPKKYVQSVLREHNKQGTILIPNYDQLSCSLICAAFENAGYQALLIEETETSILTSLRLNDGQCLPVSAVTSAAIETIEKYKLQPEDTAIFLNTISPVACNFPQYPIMAKKLLEQKGNSFENVKVFATEFDMRSLPIEVVHDVYCGYLLGGFLRRMACKIRPYELIKGQTNRIIEQSTQKLYQCMVKGDSKEDAFKEIVEELAEIPVIEAYGTRPKVSIIGDLYVRDNDVFNQQLINEVENYGAEVVTTPFNYIVRMIAVKHNYLLREHGSYLRMLTDKLFVDLLEKFEKRFFEIANEVLQEEFPLFDESIFEYLSRYNLSLKHGGETAQNVMKIYSLLDHYPDLKLFIHINPIFCCPGLVSESIFKKLEKDIGIPIVSIIYDGTATKRNEVLAPYLHYIAEEVEWVESF